MLGVYVTVPVACFRKGLAREYLETEPLPPPATCYGFLLSLVGETDRRRHVGVRVVPVLVVEEADNPDGVPGTALQPPPPPPPLVSCHRAGAAVGLQSTCEVWLCKHR